MTQDRYRQSTDFLALAELLIPLGSQTFSKSKTQYPIGAAPLFMDHARGSLAWDIDGNRYIDLVNSLGAITLGYCDESVDSEVKEQLSRGILFSLPGKLEFEVASLLTELIPSAEMVRFGKNGSDATSASIRVARAFTGRDHVAVCGYHGWQDWFIGSTSRDKGVPKVVSDLTHVFNYNEIESLGKIFAQFPNQISAVIMEPMNAVFPNGNFLEEVQRITHENGALLIFDETVTGFRLATGGAQEYLRVTPDLSTFGKGLANGHPLSAVVGKREIMKEMEEIFFSTTFGGELLSLAAAKAVLTRHKNENICKSLTEIGTKLSQGVHVEIQRHGLTDTLGLSGHPAWTFLNWSDNGGYGKEIIKTYFLQEMLKRGVLVLGTHNVSLSLSVELIDDVIHAYSDVLSNLRIAIDSHSLVEKLESEPLIPLFKIR